MENIPLYIRIIAAFPLPIIIILIFLMKKKSKTLDELKDSFNKLQKSFDTLDEQAKLIVKTDLELNKAQEESDRRLNGLDALQKTSRLISTTLDEKEIFHRLDQSLITELGFEKNLVLTYDNDVALHAHVTFGFSKEDIPFILTNLKTNLSLINSLKEGISLCSADAPIQKKEIITQLFHVEHFVISPILTKDGLIGLLFAGNLSNAAPITEGDKELVAILANQIGQSLENARLFEEVFRSSQMLELKVQQRTKQLAEALEEVQNISKTKSEFISAVSHELRTPLTSIKGYASILMAGKLGDIPEAVKERLGKINTHSDNLVELINDLLDISRIESGRVEMTIKPCNIANLIENVHDLLTPQMKDKNIQWVTQIKNSIPEIPIDIRQIERVFINLVSNAIKFTPEQGTITIKTQGEDGLASFEISDTGIGISQEDIIKLFDEFYRVENEINQNVKGTGLGLPLVKKIIEAHKGQIWATSKVNEGTAFHFTLPYKNT